MFRLSVSQLKKLLHTDFRISIHQSENIITQKRSFLMWLHYVLKWKTVP